MTAQGPFPRTPPPHIRSGDSLAKRYWFKSAALLPVLIAAVFFGRVDFLRILFLAVMGVTGFEWLSGGFFKNRTGLSNGEAVLTGLLFALLLPERCPSLLIVLGAFMAAFMISGCFGGLGSRLLNAAVFGRVFLDFGFPGAMTEPAVFLFAGDPWMFGAVLASAALFLIQQQIYFETPVYFTGIFLAGAALFGPSGTFLAAAGIGIFTACFLLTDPVTLPLSRQGTNLFAIGAAFLAAVLGLYGSAVTSIGYAILFMNCLTPWFDVRSKPKRREAPV